MRVLAHHPHVRITREFFEAAESYRFSQRWPGELLPSPYFHWLAALPNPSLFTLSVHRSRYSVCASLEPRPSLEPLACIWYLANETHLELFDVVDSV